MSSSIRYIKSPCAISPSVLSSVHPLDESLAALTKPNRIVRADLQVMRSTFVLDPLANSILLNERSLPANSERFVKATHVRFTAAILRVEVENKRLQCCQEGRMPHGVTPVVHCFNK